MKKLTGKEVSCILRKYPIHPLNKKTYRQFTDKDFQTIHDLAHKRITTISKKYFPKSSHTYVKIKKNKEILEFDTIGELVQHFQINTKNLWRKKIESLGYTILEETTSFKMFFIDRKAIINTLENKYTTKELAVMNDYDLYKLLNN